MRLLLLKFMASGQPEELWCGRDGRQDHQKYYEMKMEKTARSINNKTNVIYEKYNEIRDNIAEYKRTYD